jgi:hypothetical protein
MSTALVEKTIADFIASKEPGVLAGRLLVSDHDGNQPS